MLKFFNANQKGSLKKLKLILETRKLKQKNQSITVKEIINNVKKYGDKAVIRYEKKFLKVKFRPKNIKFSKQEIDRLLKKVDKKLKKSIVSKSA